VFCTKYSRSVLTESIIEDLTKKIIEVANKNSANIIDYDIGTNYVHLIIDVNPEVGIKKTLARIKGETSTYLRIKYKELTTKLPCLWTNNKFISTVGSISLDKIHQYIEKQKGK
jgi:putative transposase